MKRVVIFIAFMLIGFISCESVDSPDSSDMTYYDPAEMIGKWAETYENYPDFNMDSSVYHSFQENGAYNIDVYDSEGGVLKNEQQYTYSEGVITVKSYSGDAKYTIVKLLDNEMEWQKIGTDFSEGTIGTDYKHFVRTDPNTQPYASHFIHNGYKVMYGEYEVSSVMCIEEMMPEHLIAPATEDMQAGRKFQEGARIFLNYDMTYAIMESGKTISSGTYYIGSNFLDHEWLCYYHPRPCSSLGYLDLTDTSGLTNSFRSHLALHQDSDKDYVVPCVYQDFKIREDDIIYSYGIRYELSYFE